VQKATADIGDASVLPRESSSGGGPVARTPIGTAKGPRAPPQPSQPLGERLGRMKASSLDAIGSGGDRKYGEATIDPDESSVLTRQPRRVTPLGMELRGSDIQANVPTISLTDDIGEQDPGSRDNHPLPGCRIELFDRPEQSAQSPCVVVHADDPDLRQGDRSGMAFPKADEVITVPVLLVAQTETVAAPTLPLGFRKANLSLSTFCMCAKGPTKVDGGLLEDLCADLVPPWKSGHLLGDGPVRGDGEPATGPFASLPGVERLDQVKA
jgi:hypothetical protein